MCKYNTLTLNAIIFLSIKDILVREEPYSSAIKSDSLCYYGNTCGKQFTELRPSIGHSTWPIWPKFTHGQISAP